MWLDRLAIYGVPLGAGLVTALVLVGPSRERPVIGARARGAPGEGAEQVAFRLETLRHLGGEYAAAPADVKVALTQGAARGEWAGSTDDQGYAEAIVRLAAPLTAGDATLTLEAGGHRHETGVLVAPKLEPVDGPTFYGNATPAMSILVPRGRLVPPFPERVVVIVTPPPEGGARPTLKVAAQGGEAGVRSGPTEAEQCEAKDGKPWIWTLDVVAQAPAVLLTVDVAIAGASARLEAPLPVTPGALWLDPIPEKLRVRSAIPREAAFVSLVDESGRTWGARVPMTTDPDGYAAGELPMPQTAPKSPATLLVSGDPIEAADGTTAWPLHPRSGRIDGARAVLLADGMPAAIAGERDRRTSARRPAYGLVLAAGLFELFYLWRRGRLAREKLEAHMRAAGVEGSEPTAVVGTLPLFWLCLLTGGLAVLFAVLAAVAAWA